MTQTPKRITSIYFPVHLLETLDRIAEQEQRSRSQLVSILCERALEVMLNPGERKDDER